MAGDLSRIAGYRLALRLVTPEDAGYIYGLRTDPRYNAHLSAVAGDAEDQRRWIEAYQVREREGREYYYVIERRDGVRCGVVRLYDIADDSFTWGSWILDHDKPPKAALESALLSFGVGFERLGLGKAFLDVRRDNVRALEFYRRLGMTETGTDDENIYFEYSRTQFLRDRDNLVSALEATDKADTR